MKLLSATSRIATIGVAATALTVFAAGTALACNQPVHHQPQPPKKECNHKPSPTPKPSTTPTPTPTPSKSPTPTPTPSTTPTPTPTATPVAGQGQVLSAATVAQPTTLPQTGAGDSLGVLTGIGSMSAASVAYIRSRKRR